METKDGTTARKRDSGHALWLHEERFKSLIALSSECYWEQDESYRFTLITGAGFETTGIDPLHDLGTRCWDHGAVPVGNNENWDKHKTVLGARQPFANFLFQRTDPQGKLHYIRISGQPLFDGRKRFQGYHGIAKDITTSTRAEQLLRLEHMVARCLADADSVSSGLRTVIRSICEVQGWECGRYLRVDQQASVLRFCEFWNVPDDAIERFIAGKRETVIGPGVGLAGRAWQSGQPTWVADINSDAGALRAVAAFDVGMRGAFHFPVIAGGNTIGVVAFNSRKVREPDERLLQAVRVIGSQIGQFLQRKQAEESLRRFRVAMDLSADLILLVDRASIRYIDVNDAACRELGYTREELLAMGPPDIFSKSREEMSQLYDRMFASELNAPIVRGVYRRKDGSQLQVEAFPRAVRSAGGDIIVSIARDITERLAAEERIQYLGTHDGLTSLPNRVMFSQLLNLAIAHARRHNRSFAVMFIDLDRFKIINDTLGHEAGDKLLQETATRFTGCLRASDVVARLGGDEFVVLVQEVSDAAQVAAVARKVLSAAIKPVVLLGQECRVTASIGICMYPADAEDEQSLMKNADSAMYLAKEQGKNNFQFYSEDIRIQSLERLTLETSLRLAMERNEFFLHYQAKLDLKTKEITGVEALLRWQHPDLGLVTPVQFIPIAEETGLIVSMGRWVLKTACAQNVAWQRDGLPPLCMAVNLSARQFGDENLLQDIVTVLEESGMRPELLELELTESMVMRDPGQARKLLTAIKQLGVRIAIDDFGVGYSSLAQIRRFPIDTLKVDRSFIRDLAENAEDRAITEAIITMGKTLSLTVVAEGVETQEQQSFLSDHACDAMQGFYFSKPIPHDEFASFMRQHLALSR